MEFDKIFNLDNIASELSVSAERAEIMIREVNEYFNHDREVNKTVVLHEFNRNRIKTDIASDYTFEIRKKVSELESMVEDMTTEYRAEQADQKRKAIE